MRDVIIVAKCDRCRNEVEVNEEPLPKWVIDGQTFRPELCPDCKETVLTELGWLVPPKPRRGPGQGHPHGKNGSKHTCPACGEHIRLTRRDEPSPRAERPPRTARRSTPEVENGQREKGQRRRRTEENPHV